MSLFLVTPLLAAALTAPAAAPKVWVVDSLGGPGHDFTDIQPAVDAADSGDVVLVKFGGYSGFTIDGKGLTVVEDEFFGFGATVFGEVDVRNVPAGEEVVIRGLQVELLDATTPVEQLSVETCLGPVLLDDVTLVRGNPCVQVSAATVTLANCSLEGSSSDATLQEPVGPGLVAQVATLYLYDTTITGGTGADDFFPAHIGLPDAGVDAVRLTQSSLFAAGCTFVGGDGGDGAAGATGGCTPGADGGDAVELVDPGSSAIVVDTVADGGEGGVAGDLACVDGTNGITWFPGVGNVSFEVGDARHLVVGSPAREGGTVSADIAGAPNEVVILAISDGQLPFPYDPFLHGALIATPLVTVIVAVGFTDAAGDLSVSFDFPLGKLPPNVEARHHVLQAGLIDLVAGEVHLTGPRSLLLLDSQF